MVMTYFIPSSSIQILYFEEERGSIQGEVPGVRGDDVVQRPHGHGNHLPPHPSLVLLLGLRILLGVDVILHLQYAVRVLQEPAGTDSASVGLPRQDRQPPLGPASLISFHRRRPLP